MHSLPPERPPAGTPARRRALAGAALAALLLAWLWTQRTPLAEHLAAWHGQVDAATLPYAALQPALDEAALQRLSPGLAWRCAGAPAARRCEAAAASAEFVQGRLQALTLRVPWWRHHATARGLVQALGAPDRLMAAPDTPAPGQAVVWQLPGGSLRLPRSPGPWPLQWSTLRWDAPASGPATAPRTP